MRMRIAQCLCSKRHTIFAFAIDDQQLSTEDVMAMLQDALKVLLYGRGEVLGQNMPKKINPYCGLCGDPTGNWSCEVALSKEYASWEEAKEVMGQLEKAQQRTHELLDTLGFSYDSKMWRKRAQSN